MSAAVTMKGIAETSPRFKARMAAAFFLLTMLTAAFTELFVRISGKLNFVADIAAGALEIAGMVGVTLLFYDIFKPVNGRLSFLAAAINLVALTFETFQILNIGLVFGGSYCLLIGYLIFKSTFLPRILGVPMAFAGLGWLTFLSTPLADHLSPYNLAAGILGEGLVMLWLLVMGVNAQRWQEQASAAGQRRTRS
jgi:Domain of unknown function (DUF4386)